MKIQGISVFSGRPIEAEINGTSIVKVAEVPSRPGLPYLAPGLIDLQVNGYRGIDYSSSELRSEQVEELVAELGASGTTSHLPTIITAPKELMIANLRLIEAARNRNHVIAAAVPGYHIEGPFISPEDGARGVHSLVNVRHPDYEEYLEWQDAAGGHVKIVTLAPELPGALDFIERITDDGVIASIGHSAASPEKIREAVKAGARMSTHLGNGSHAHLPRLRNYLWEQLAADELTAGIIADGYHLPSAVVKTVARAKGLDRLFLVSDVAVHGGAEPGVYPWGDNMVEVFPDGHLGLHQTDFLAGAGHLLDHDVARFVQFSGETLAAGIRLCTLNPARLIGLNADEEFCRVGATADLVVFDYDPGAERLGILKTIQAGRALYG